MVVLVIILVSHVISVPVCIRITGRVLNLDMREIFQIGLRVVNILSNIIGDGNGGDGVIRGIQGLGVGIGF